MELATNHLSRWLIVIGNLRRLLPRGIRIRDLGGVGMSLPPYPLRFASPHICAAQMGFRRREITSAIRTRVGQISKLDISGCLVRSIDFNTADLYQNNTRLYRNNVILLTESICV